MLYTRKSLLAVKVEATPGVAETLAGTDAAYNAMNPEITADIAVSSRPLQASFKQLKGVPGPMSGQCTFSIELIGDGAGTYPVWATTLLAACGVIESPTDTGTPSAEAPGANVKTLTMGVYTDGVLTQLRGCSGNVQFVFRPGEAVMLNFTFTGAWVGQSAVAVPSFTPPTLFPIRSTGACTINSVAQKFQTCTIDLGNTVTLRPDIAGTNGFAYATVTDRVPTITLDAEAALIATEDPFGDWEDGTTRAFSLQCDDGTDIVTFAAAAAQYTAISPGDREGLRLNNKTMRCTTTGSSAELTIAFSS